MKWVSTKEKMPEDNTEVLILDERGHIHEASFNVPEWSPGQWFDGDDGWWDKDSIGWWMTTPELPEGFVVGYWKPWMAEPKTEEISRVGYFMPMRRSGVVW